MRRVSIGRYPSSCDGKYNERTLVNNMSHLIKWVVIQVFWVITTTNIHSKRTKVTTRYKITNTSFFLKSTYFKLSQLNSFLGKSLTPRGVWSIQVSLTPRRCSNLL